MNAVMSVGYTNMIELICNPERVTALKELGKIIGESCLCGTKSPVQGQMLLLLAISEGVPITEIKRKYHIVNGTDLTMRADYMRAEFRRLGGVYKWIDTGEDGKLATIWVKYKDNEETVSYSIEDAKQEGLIKPGSRWTKQPGDMLRARASTKSIRMVCSEVIAGFATDEELQSGAIDDGTVITVPSIDSTSESLKIGHQELGTQKPELSGTVTTNVVALITEDQMRELTHLYSICNISMESQAEALRVRACTVVSELTETQANEIITKLRAIAAEPPVPPAVVTDDAGKILDETYNLIQDEIKIIAQKSGTGPAFVESVRGHLNKSGFALKDLTQGEALKLLEAIKLSDAKIFLGVELRGFQDDGSEGKA